ncbi:DHA2 family efflux MFS transporter permease subunit [Ornithinibacillus californiensis]|uniref:DHA2 family efflux MFS transporter permease subunit n=1 Tax=Ornithinibacillus californiensis TaxID=161536 RepID=UPI00064DEE54|nr:DHA2 family efflux MFS transporter permease subunit [Ornithinibacillus californiensis]
MTENISQEQKPPYGIIAILFIGAFVAILNETFLNVALPSIMNEFAVSPAKVQWLATGYMLVNGILIPASAFFIQRFTNRSIFLAAMGLFTLGTLLASISPTFGILLTARMIQASGSAIMMPLLMNVMLVAFPIEKRGQVMGFFGLVMIVAPALGPTLSGVIVQHLGWRMLFTIVLPFAIFSLVFAVLRLKNFTPQHKIKLDVLSILLSSIGFGGLLYGFSSAGELGWSNPIVYGTITAGTLGLVLLITRQFKLDEPLLEFRIFKYPMFALSSAISVTIALALFSGMILIPLYIQEVRGFSPTEAGLLMLPGALMMGIMSPISGRLFDKHGAKTLSIVGLIIITVTTLIFSKLSMTTPYLLVGLMFSIRAFGMSLVNMPVMTNGLNQLPVKDYPHGTAMNNTLSQVAGAIGSALLVTVMNKRSEARLEEITREPIDMSLIDPESSVEVTKQLSNLAMLNGINFSFFVSALIVTIALVLAFFIKRVPIDKQENSVDLTNPPK